MADISIIHNGSTDYNVKDADGRLALAEVENKGAKNLLPLTGESTDIFTINADGTMTANGSSSTSKRDFAYYIGAPPKGRFVFSGCPPTGSSTTYRMFLQSVVGTTYTTLATLTGDPVEVDLTNIDKIRVLMSIYAGYTPNNIKFSPMICTKAEWDISHTYVPYGKTNAELTNDTSALSAENTSQQAEINYAVNSGTKNIFNIQATSAVQRTTTVLNPDGGITISCNAAVWATRNVRAEIPEGDYICSLFVDAVTIGGGAFAFFINQSDDQSTWTELARQTSITSISQIDKLITVTQKYLRITTNINNSDTSATNSATIRLMLRPAAITDQTYEPYAIPNPVLTQEVNWNVNNGVKNLFDINTSLPLKIYHTTYALSDGSLTVTSNGSWGHHSVPVNLPAGNYIFTATISNFSKDSSASESSVRMRVTDTTATGGIQIASKAVTGNGVFELPFTWTGGLCYIQYYPNYTSTTTYVSSFTASDNMVRRAEIIDPAYEPYALSNTVITPALIEQVDNGAKNKISGTFTSQTLNGVAFTVNADGTITANRVSSSSNAANLPSTNFTLKAGTYVFSCSPNPQRDTAYDSYVYNIDTSTTIARDNPNDSPGNVFTIIQDTTVRVNVRVTSGYATSNLIFSPMICTAADWAVSQKFVPYAPTNRGLYEEKIDHDLPNVSGSILDYADTFAPGIYFARQSSSTGSRKPINNRRYVYNIYVYSQATATIIAIEGENGEDPMIYTANKVSGSWGQWIRSCDYTYGIIIPDNSDLNSYTTPGKYYGTNSAANTASNLPVARDAFNFTLTVEKVTPIHIVQHLQICRLADDPNIYRRRLYNNNWGSWYKFEGTQVT